MKTKQSADNSTPRGQRGPRSLRRTLQTGLDIAQDNGGESWPRNDDTSLPNIDTAGILPSRDPSPHLHMYGPPPSNEGALSPMIKQAFQYIHGKGTTKCAHAVHYFTSATEEPPITKKSLGELDISSIINNSKLRHDVNFDRELHFRPNMDGPKGRAKREAHNGYWVAVTAELDLYRWMLEVSVPLDVARQCQKRIPTMFDTIKVILKNLVPERDQPAVEQHLDPSMIMQEIEKGVCDFVTIAQWLAKLLKRHCAPMRDDMVDRMVEKVGKGTSAWISEGLCELFGVLEAMKLDVANHQIRHLRALLIEDTINFEQKYHVSRISRKRYNIQYARSWYLEGKDALERIPLTTSWPNRDVEEFVSALYRSLLPNSSTPLPDTFNLDLDRLRILKLDLDALIRESICCDLLEQMVRRKGKICSATAKSAFRKDLQVIICEGRSPIIWDIQSISVELTRHALRECGITAKTEAALTVFADHKLSEAFASPDMRAAFATSHKCAVSKELFSSVKSHLTSSPWDIFNTLVAPTIPSGTTPFTSPFKSDRKSDVLQRITHIAVLHWRVWEDIVYNNDDDQLDSLCPSSTISRTPSPSHIVEMKMRLPSLPPSTEPPATDCEVSPATTEVGTSPEVDSTDQGTVLKSA